MNYPKKNFLKTIIFFFLTGGSLFWLAVSANFFLILDAWRTVKKYLGWEILPIQAFPKQLW